MRLTIPRACLYGLGLLTSQIAASWEQEPATVFGLALGVPIEQAGAPLCPPRPPGHPLPTLLCIQPETNPYSGFVREVFGLPKLEGLDYYTSHLSLYNGVVEGFSFVVHQNQFVRLRSILEARYGVPSSIESLAVTTGAGAAMTASLLIWQGKKMKIAALERSSRFDRAEVFFTDVATTEKKAKAGAEIDKSSAKKL